MATATEEAVFTQDMTVRYYEQDPQGRLRPCDIFNWFQEIARLHRRQYKSSIADIEPRGYTWVVHRAKVVVHSMPRVYKDCRVATWVHHKMDKFSVRECVITAPDGARLLSAATQWVVLSLTDKKPAKLSQVSPGFPVCEDRAVQGDLKPIYMPQGLQDLGSTEVEATPWCMDSNRHVNNSVYVLWMCDSVYPHTADTPYLRELEVNYRREVKLGQRIICRCLRAPDGAYYHELVEKASGETVATLRSVWSREP